jgi:hypothetical protein
MIKQLSGCEDADDVDIRQWILADDSDVGHQMYTDNDIVSLVLSVKVVKMTRMKVIHTKLQRKQSYIVRDWKRWNALCCM